MIPLCSESDDRSHDPPGRSSIASWLLAALVAVASLSVQPGVDALQEELLVARLRGASDVARPDGLLGHLVLQRGEHLHLSQLVGVAFVHGDRWHLLGNLLVLLLAGGPLCRALGTGRFVAVWLGSAVVASLGALAFTDASFCMGASGVAMGLVAACAVAAPTTRVWVLTHPLPLLLGLAALLGWTQAGGWGGILAAILVQLAWSVRALFTWGSGADLPEGLVARLFGFILLRPRVGWLALALVGLDLVGVAARDGEGLAAAVLRALAGGSCHEAHLAGALGGALLAAALASSVRRDAGAREQARAAWAWAKRLARRARATWEALEAANAPESWPAPAPVRAPAGALRRPRSPAVERARRRHAA